MPEAQPNCRSILVPAIERTTVPATNPANALATRTADAIYFVVTSPEYALQR